jgi:hypothetical protein
MIWLLPAFLSLSYGLFITNNIGQQFTFTAIGLIFVVIYSITRKTKTYNRKNIDYDGL